MSMSRKDYNKLADAIYWNLDNDQDQTYRKDQIALLITNALKGTNPRYQSDKFYRACMNDRTVKPKRTRTSKTREFAKAGEPFGKMVISG